MNLLAACLRQPNSKSCVMLRVSHTDRQAVLYSLSRSTSSPLMLHKLSVEPATVGVCKTQIVVFHSYFLSDSQKSSPSFCVHNNGGATRVWQTLCTSHMTWRNSFSLVCLTLSLLSSSTDGMVGQVSPEALFSRLQTEGGKTEAESEVRMLAHTHTHTHPVFISVCLEGVCVLKRYATQASTCDGVKGKDHNPVTLAWGLAWGYPLREYADTSCALWSHDTSTNWPNEHASSMILVFIDTEEEILSFLVFPDFHSRSGRILNSKLNGSINK